MANFCSSCGRAVSPDARFCAGCGNSLEDVEQPAAPEPEAEEQPAPEPELSEEQPPLEPEPSPPPPTPSSTATLDAYLAKIEASFMRTWRQLFNVDEPEPSQEQPADDKGRSAIPRVLKGCGIAVGVVVGLFLLLVIVVAIFAPAEDEDDTEISAPAPAEQTEQPAPTAKPEPTPVPLPLCQRPDEREYLETLYGLETAYMEDRERVALLMDDVGDNPLVLLEPRWRNSVKQSTERYVETVEAKLALRAPDSLSEIDQAARNLAEEEMEIDRLLQAAMKELDAEQYDQGLNTFLESGEQAERVLGYQADFNDTLLRVCGEDKTTAPAGTENPARTENADAPLCQRGPEAAYLAQIQEVQSNLHAIVCRCCRAALGGARDPAPVG